LRSTLPFPTRRSSDLSQRVILSIPVPERIAKPRSFEFQLRQLFLLPNLQRAFHERFLRQSYGRIGPLAGCIDQQSGTADGRRKTDRKSTRLNSSHEWI